MGKKQAYPYQNVTLFKDDIRALVAIFYDNLEDVTIDIDGLPLLALSQLDEFAPAYQATSFIARGYTHQMGEDDTKPQEDRVFIELKITKVVGLLVVWNNGGRVEPPVVMHIRKVLLRCQNPYQQALVLINNMVLGLPGSVTVGLMVRAFLEPQTSVLPITQYYLAIGISILLIPVAVVISGYCYRILKIEQTVFLLPGMMRSTHVYGWGRAMGRSLVALMLSGLMLGGLVFLYRNLEAVESAQAIMHAQATAVSAQATAVSAQATLQALTNGASKNDTTPLSQYMHQKPIYTSSNSDYSYSVYSYTIDSLTYHNSVYSSSNGYYTVSNGRNHLS